MRGRKRPGFVLQPRDRALLTMLDTMRVVDREQAGRIGPFGSVTRTNTRLLKLTGAGLLTRITVGTTRGGHQHLYTRTRQGAAAIGQMYRPPPWNAHSPIVAGQPLLEHQLRLNQLHLAVRDARDHRLDTWRTFVRPPVSTSPLIPDAFLTIAHGAARRALFVEVDLATEPLRTWIRKADRYLALARSGQFEAVFGEPTFGVAVVLPSLKRVHTVRDAIATRTSKLFWLTTFDAMHPARLWTAVWWRPAGTAPVSIF